MKTHQSLIIISILFFVLFTADYSNSQDTWFIDNGVESGLQGAVNYPLAGIAWGDFNNDGFADLFSTGKKGNRLFQNLDNGKFQDIAAQAGILNELFEPSGAAWGDYDGDGYLDLFVANMGSADPDNPEGPVVNRLYHNNGNSTFSEVGETAGVAGIIEGVTGGSTGASWVDFNGDDRLDLLVSNRFLGPLLYQNLGNGKFQNVTQSAGLTLNHGELLSVESASWCDYDNDGDPDVFFAAAVPEADEDEHEHEHEESLSEEFGVSFFRPSATPSEESPHPITQNHLFRNNGNGTFTDVSEAAGVSDPNSAVSFSAVWGDYNHDGWMDLYVGNIGSNTENTASPSRLYRNNGNGTFTDVAAQAGLDGDIYAVSAIWLDVNNDGLPDLHLIYHPDHADYPAGILFQTPQPLYINQGNGTFTNVNPDADAALNVTGMIDISHLIGLGIADFDLDGDSDLVVTEEHGDGPIRFYVNRNAAAGNHWLGFRIRSDSPNRFAVGARLFVTAGGVTQIRDIGVGNSGWGSQNSIVQTIGLGSQTGAEIQVRWPNGKLESFGKLQGDGYYALVQGQGTSTPVEDWSIR